MVILLYLSIAIFFEFISALHSHVLGSSPYSFYYDAPLSVVMVIGIVLCQRPRLLALSRWVPRPGDLAIAVPVGLLIAGGVWLLVPNQSKFVLPHASLIPVVFIGPVAEEVLLRGVFLRSLREHEPLPVAVLMVTLLAAIMHVSFWFAVPTQLALSIVYLAMGNSLAASIAVHITINATGFLVAGRFFHQ
jgi:membrane protease YdiL (CAAX protease family)